MTFRLVEVDRKDQEVETYQQEMLKVVKIGVGAPIHWVEACTLKVTILLDQISKIQ